MHKSLAVFLLVAFATVPPLTALAAPITIAWSTVGNPGNAADPATGYGAVGYSYKIGTYDVTASQYVTFLNSNDPTGANTLGLYNSNMSNAYYGGVAFNSGAASGDMYSAVAGRGNDPINYVTFYDATRFANWLDNGQRPGSTETGAYTLLGGTPTPSNAATFTRNATATVFLPNENEWYKAAYYNPVASTYYLYPTSSNTAPTAGQPTTNPNSANYALTVQNLTPVGAYSGTTSPYGAYDMAGDVYQFEETSNFGYRVLRGGSYNAYSFDLVSTEQIGVDPSDISNGNVGFRVASILTPEPSTEVLAIIACGVILLWRKRFR
jgi:formylglycine-generating enzyme required for sulfatase activity